MTLLSMIDNVKRRMTDRHETVVDGFFINQNRNYVIMGDQCTYLLKWNDKPFMAAGRMVPGIVGIGETVNYELYHRMFLERFAYKQCKIILFQWTDSKGVVYGQDAEIFTRKSKAYTQSNGEKVLVISVADLKRFE